MKLFTALLSSLFLLTLTACMDDSDMILSDPNAPQPGTGLVISWVPSYSISRCKTMVEKDFGGVTMADGLTHLALQFWAPNPADGSIYYIPNGGMTGSDEDVQWFVEWGNRNGVKTMLCIYNNDGTWNWNGMVVPIISDKSLRTTLITNLISEMNRLNLDGIEVDLEGPSVKNATDRENFYLFMEELSIAVRAESKDLTIAAFHSNYHTPGTGMWQELFPLVDGITSMGYEQIGILGDQSEKLDYESQAEMAEGYEEKFMLGMPASNSWLELSALEQVQWAVNNEVGIGIWDAALSGSDWRTAEIWNELKKIKGTGSK